MYPTKIEEDYIVRNLTYDKDRIKFGSDGMTYKQMSLFDTGGYAGQPVIDDKLQVASGQI